MLLSHPKDSLRILTLFLWFFLFCLIQRADFAQEKPKTLPYQDIAQELAARGLQKQQAFSFLKRLTAIGPRLTGSPQAEEAVELARQIMEEIMLENIHLESTQVNRWVRGEKEEAELISSTTGTSHLSICAIGGSISTPEGGITAEVVEVHTFKQLRNIGAKARGKIVFFNRPMDPALVDTFHAYGNAADQRVQGAAEAAKAGALAVLVRSLTTSLDDSPHTGMMRYEDGVPRIPAACISTKGAEYLSNVLKNDPTLKVHMKMNSRYLPPVISHNVVGEITGAEKPLEIILVGGHLDSWDLGTGAHDDGSGCAHSLEALRLLKELGLKPKRTIRAVLFMDEEFGGTGGRDYVQDQKRKGEHHVAAVESDRGGFFPLWFGVSGDAKALSSLNKWDYLFQSLGMCGIRQGGGGVDIAPLGKSGTLLIGLIPDFQRYFDFHHSSRDVLDAVNSRDLELGAVSLAVLAYVLAQEGI